VKCPYGKIFEIAGISSVSTSTDGRDRSKSMRLRCCQAPRSKTAHADACQVNPIWVNAVGTFDFIQKGTQRGHRPILTLGTLGRNGNKWKVWLLLYNPGDTVPFHIL
jgi:hypothetical protein